MEITANTSLDDILKSSEVQDITSETFNKINEAVLSRVQALTSCMMLPGFSSEIDGDKPLFNAANDISAKYSNFLSELNSTFEGIGSLAVNKEYDELVELKDAVEKKILEIDDKIENCQSQIDYYNSLGEGEEKSSSLDIYNNAVSNKKEYKKTKTEYNKKLEEIEKRISQLDLSGVTSSSAGQQSSDNTGDSSDFINVIPDFEIGEDGRPTKIPSDFQIDSHHRLNIPGWGCFYEAADGSSLEFHYDPGTNKFYYGSVGEDWDNFDYANDIYGLTPEEMKKSCVAGGIMPG